MPPTPEDEANHTPIDEDAFGDGILWTGAVLLHLLGQNRYVCGRHKLPHSAWCWMHRLCVGIGCFDAAGLRLHGFRVLMLWCVV